MKRDVDVCGLTHRGKVRKQNEDAYFLSGGTYPVVALIADGMGGHSGGRLASSMAVNYMANQLSKIDLNQLTYKELKQLLEDTSRVVWKESLSDKVLENMGTTMTAAIILENRVIIGNIGDSRPYMMRAETLDQITTDHSYVQYLVEKGILMQDEAETHPYKNIITRAIGMETVSADVFVTAFQSGNVLLLCTDGVSNFISKKELEEIIRTSDTAKQMVFKMKSMTLERGASDNFTAVVVSRPEEAPQNEQ